MATIAQFSVKLVDVGGLPLQATFQTPSRMVRQIGMPETPDARLSLGVTLPQARELAAMLHRDFTVTLDIDQSPEK